MAPVWQRAISVVVLAVFTGLPVSGTVCAALCAPVPPAEATAADHHGQHTDHSRHASPSPSRELVDAQLTMGARPHYDCADHPGLADGSAALSAVRTDAGLISAEQHVLSISPYQFRPASLRVDAGSSPPPGTTSPTRAPLVLRI